MEAEFLYPVEEHLMFYESDTVAVRYESNIKDPRLYTFCWVGNDLQTKQELLHVKPMNATELILINFHTTSDNCWFNLRDNDHPERGINSVHFGLSEDQRSKTTLGISSAMPTATTSSYSSVASSSSSSSTTTTGRAPSSSSTAVTSSSSNLSRGAKAGVGVGVALGVLTIAVLVGILCIIKKRKRHTLQIPQAEEVLPKSELESPGPKCIAELAS